VLPTLEDPALEHFEMLLAESDPALQAWLLNGKAIEGSEFGSLIAEIRVFHGLDGKT
jgi:succinate dehydrogenase flavin-adding protein (antitoxin of CptAB toxin-antitoxin module)